MLCTSVNRNFVDLFTKYFLGDSASCLTFQVDSLKTQLEQSQNRNSKLQHQISELRSKTHQRQASRDSVVGSPSTPSRKHSQVISEK